jgi:hypothetical protein
VQRLRLKEREADDPTQQELDKAHKRIGDALHGELLAGVEKRGYPLKTAGPA